MAKKASETVTIDDIRDKLETVRAIADALASQSPECAIEHDSLWRIGLLMQTELGDAIDLLDRYHAIHIIGAKPFRTKEAA